LHSKGNHKQNEKTIYRRGKSICKLKKCAEDLQFPKAIEIKTKINKLDFIKLNKLLHSKENHTHTHTHTHIHTHKPEKTMKWKKVVANNVMDRGLISKIYK